MIAWLIAQLLKVPICLITEKKLNFMMLLSSGGMPSSHSATICALATACGVNEGVGSPIFAVCTIMAFIVMYDAAGVRRAVGQQAKILNRIMEDISEGKTDEINSKLKELVGHTRLEVIAGAALGVIIGLIFA